jgi:uncharacterized protein (UPF0261 family)
MNKLSSIAVLGTYDTKGEEHLFLKERIEKQGFAALTINIGTQKPAFCEVDIDLFDSLHDRGISSKNRDRDKMIQAMLQEAKDVIKALYDKGEICGIVSAGGGSGTHLCTGVMQVLPLGVPKVMLSTVASRDMSSVVGTKDITMMHSVSDILGINSILGGMLDKAAAAVCAMARSKWDLGKDRLRIALSFFGFITQAAEQVKGMLEDRGYEVVTFHANGTGGNALEELAAEGYFDGILDLATHELADHLMNGYCGNIGSHRFEPVMEKPLPRLVVPGGLDCVVLEFDRQSIPDQYKDRKIFFYDFRSAIRLNEPETKNIARQLSARLNPAGEMVKVLIPMQGWSVADHVGGPLYDPDMNDLFVQTFKQSLDPAILVLQEDFHINDQPFAKIAADIMDGMIVS